MNYEYHKTPYGSSRVWIYGDVIPGNVIIFFNILSIWGGYDKNETGYMSWEIDSCISEDYMRAMMCRFDIGEKKR